MQSFEKLIKDFPRNISVMDVGYGGLDGENTTDFLRVHFDRVVGICKDGNAVLRYMAEKGGVHSWIFGSYPQDMRDNKYDLLVLDPRIEDNLKFWSYEGMDLAWQFVNSGGHIITYVMMTNEYGDADTQAKIAQHRKSWWDREWKGQFEMRVTEERRPYIDWVLLKKP